MRCLARCVYEIALVVMVLGLTGIVGMAAYHITKLFVPGSGS